MTRLCTLIIVSAVLMAGCAADNALQQAAPRGNSNWILLASPASADFPQGQLGSPRSQWTRIEEYPTFEQCDASEQQARNQLGRAVDCIASDDPQLVAKD